MLDLLWESGIYILKDEEESIDLESLRNDYVI